MYFELTNRPNLAAEADLDGAQMGVMSARGGGILPMLVGMACEAISLHRFEDLLPRLSESELTTVSKWLDHIIAIRQPLADTMAEEGRASTAIQLEILRSPNADTLKGQWEAVKSLEGFTLEDIPLRRRVTVFARYALTNKEAAIRANMAYCDALVAEFRRPYRGPSRIPVPDNLYAELVFPIWDNARIKPTAMDSAYALLRTEVAIYRCRKERGRYPSHLSELVPRYLAIVPDDPFGGAAGVPLLYRTTGKGFQLYGRGIDMKDHGGQTSRFPGDPQGGDIVARRMWQHKALDEVLAR